MTDTELLDVLEAEIKERPLMLWDGVGDFPGGPRGLSLIGGRSLRRALEVIARSRAAGERPMEPQKARNAR